MSIPSLSRLARQPQVRIVLVDADSGLSLSLAGLVQPLRCAASLLEAGRLRVELLSADAFLAAPPADIALLVGPDTGAASASAGIVERLREAPVWGAVGGAVFSLVRSGALDGARVALPWLQQADADAAPCDRAILTPHLFECDGHRLTCCGGAASLDFSLTLIDCLCGPDVQAQVKEILCVEQVRAGDERQRVALQARFGALQPKLSEAVALMEANIEEPLAADDIAQLVGISRRQLERLFKQYLGSVPSRYYVGMRLRRARALLIETNHSIVQVGLMCGFSSASHFSTAYRALFDMTPREERQRKLIPGA